MTALTNATLEVPARSARVGDRGVIARDLLVCVAGETLNRDRVRRMGAKVASKDNGWSPGDLVRLREGPFADFPGKVLSVDQTRGLVEVEVDIFGRETRLEVPPDHLEHRQV